MAADFDLPPSPVKMLSQTDGLTHNLCGEKTLASVWDTDFLGNKPYTPGWFIRVNPVVTLDTTRLGVWSQTHNFLIIKLGYQQSYIGTLYKVSYVIKEYCNSYTFSTCKNDFISNTNGTLRKYV